MIKNKSKELFEKAKQYFPGGVNSPVRAFRSVGGTPLFIVEGKGAEIRDADGNKFIDFCCSWGPLILGHSNKVVLDYVKKTIEKGISFGTPTILENTLAELILKNHRFIDKLRFVNSGTEATMTAIRLARGITKKSKIIKFDGCYHGHADSLLVNAGSGLVTLGISSSAGVPQEFANETIVLPLNDIDAVLKAMKKYKNQIAAIIIEPIPANNGLLLQSKEYLKKLREISKLENVLLIFDEVISGFRVGFEGAAGYYNIQPDILTFGKIIGGGLPVGAYGASREIMSHVAPEGNVYQAGTLSGNPVAMSAGIAQLSECLKDGFYKELECKTLKFVQEINQYAKKREYDFSVQSIASIFWFNFSNKKTQIATQIKGEYMQDKFMNLYNFLLENGVYLGPSGYEVGFISQAHTDEQIEKTVVIIKKGLNIIFK